MSQTKETNANQLDSQDVGLIFVREYYTFLNKKPHRLHAFYNKDSLFVRGDEGTITNTAKGQEEIRKKIEECRFEDCKVLVTQVDSQTSANGGILIQVLGEMCNHNGPSQKFSQTFFLAPQPNGFYVLNDIFRFLKDEVEMDYYSCDPTPTTPPPVRKESPIPLRRIETVIVETPVSPVMYEQRIQEPMMKPVETIVIERADSPVPVVGEKKKKSHGDKASKAEA
ncbi:putative G3BP-like protein, partial [Choanephora cucurbitarum]